MTWLDRYRTASWRGVPFRVEDHGAGGGRRVVIHEFAGTDERLVQDFGRATETLALRGYLVGADYDLERDRLIEALGQPGPGELVHPYLGTIQVQVTNYEWSESRDEGGMVRLALQFVEIGTAGGVLSTRSGSRQAADAAAASTTAAAVGGFSPADALEGVAETVEAFAATLQSFSLTGPLAAAARAGRLAQRLADAVLAVTGFPLQQAQLVRDAVVALDAAVDSRRELLGLHMRLLTQRPKLRGGASVFALRRDKAAQQTADLFRAVAASEAVRAAVRVQWPSRQDAEAARALLLAEVDDLQLTASDALYPRLGELLAALVEAIPGPAGDLPELAQVELERPVPALVLAYRLYRDRGRADELVARNAAKVPHPGRMPTGARLEVVSA